MPTYTLCNPLRMLLAIKAYLDISRIIYTLFALFIVKLNLICDNVKEGTCMK